ncbi:helix-turn-helix domain-containing protein [Ammoniphilus sp. YIM 78166]|uniref:helix-turn-helix domain-containing protein n=1 Tax=Ammoniphilus sp. YIM 78166 TaxID=1644106 RepID=UPI00106F44C7|nr:helix-turn-helix domain-containing protein [Ammoniphilus sp. YIM 78166]
MEEIGAQIIQELGINAYLIWMYLKEKSKIPPIKEIAEALGRQERTVRRWVKELKQRGYLATSR